jgi:hypothetical protein
MDSDMDSDVDPGTHTDTDASTNSENGHGYDTIIHCCVSSCILQYLVTTSLHLRQQELVIVTEQLQLKKGNGLEIASSFHYERKVMLLLSKGNVPTTDCRHMPILFGGSIEN